jgi:hypothetical protein
LVAGGGGGGRAVLNAVVHLEIGSVVGMSVLAGEPGTAALLRGVG